MLALLAIPSCRATVLAALLQVVSRLLLSHLIPVAVAIAIEITMNATFVNTVFVAITTTLSVPMLELLLPMLCLCILATSALVANRKAVIGPSTARSCRKIFCING